MSPKPKGAPKVAGSAFGPRSGQVTRITVLCYGPLFRFAYLPTVWGYVPFSGAAQGVVTAAAPLRPSAGPSRTTKVNPAEA